MPCRSTPHCESTEAFDRMFERDKEDLRELGVPLVTGSDSAWFEDEPGYRIDRAAYALPEIEFTAEELAVLGLASRVWQQASLAGPAARALVKLRALGVETDDESLVGVEPRVRAAEPAFDPLYAATRDRAPVTLPVPQAGRRDRRATRRAVGADQPRRAGGTSSASTATAASARAFRLSRIEGSGASGSARGSLRDPGGPRPREHSPGPPVVGRDRREARLRLRASRCEALRLRSRSGRRSRRPGRRARRRRGSRRGGRLGRRSEIAVGDLESLAEEVAEPRRRRRRRCDPPDLREAVVRRLRAVLDVQTGHRTPGEGPARDATGGDRVSVGATTRLSRLLAMVPWLLRRQGVPLERGRPALRHHAEANSSRTSNCSSSAVRPATCPTTSSRPTGSPAGSTSATPTRSPGRCGSASTRPSRCSSGCARSPRCRACTTARRSTRRSRSSPPPPARPPPGWPGRSAVELARGAQEAMLAAVRDALRRHRRLHLRYLVPSRDETTERDVDPMRLVAVAGRWYLEGVVPPGRGRPAVPARPGRRGRGARRRRHPAARRGLPGRRARACSRRPRTTSS